MNDADQKRFLLLFASVGAALLLFYLFFRYAFWWLLPFLLAFGISALLEPLIERMETRMHFRRSFSAALLTLLLLFLAGGLLSLLLSTLLSEAYRFLGTLPVLLERIPQRTEELLARIESYCAACPEWLRQYPEQLLRRLSSQGTEIFDKLTGKLWELLKAVVQALPRGVLGVATGILAIYFTSASYPRLCSFVRRRLSSEKRRTLRVFRSGAIRSLSQWVRAQLLLCTLTFLQLLLGFSLIRQDFPVLTAFLITLVDALPVFGTGTVLVPWALGCLLLGNGIRAIALLLLYFLTLCVRTVLEPKLLSARAGVPPVVSLFAMYLGFCTFGVGGMILFPLLLLFAAQIRAGKN